MQNFTFRNYKRKFKYNRLNRNIEKTFAKNK